MKIKAYAIFLVVISTLLLIIVFYEKEKFSEITSQNEKITKELNMLKTIIEQKNQIAFYNFQNENKNLYSIKVKDLNGHNYPFYQILGENSFKVFGYFDSRMCTVCLEREWKNFLSLKDGLQDDLLILSRGYPKGFFLTNDKFSGLLERVFIPEEGVFEVSDSPIYFIYSNGNFSAFVVEKNTDDTFRLLKKILKHTNKI